MAASTQNQALNALMFLYEQVLGVELGDIGPVDRADRPTRRPMVLARAEVQRAVKQAADAAEIEKRATCHNPSP